jgi:hypothetical protein
MLSRLRSEWQGWRIRKRGDIDLDMDDPYGRMYMTRSQVADLRVAVAQSGVDTPGCDCGHDGMGVSWHGGECTWKAGRR